MIARGWLIEVLLGSLAVTGCGTPGSTSSAKAQPSLAQVAASQRASVGAISVVQSLALADAMFRFDPDLHPDAGANGNASAILGNINSSDGGSVSVIGFTNSADAGNVTVGGDGGNVSGGNGGDAGVLACAGDGCADGGAGFTVSFGSGCVIDGIALSGSIAIDVSLPAPGTLTVALTFTDLVVDGWDLDGTASFTTSDGSTFTVALNLTHSGTTTVFNGTVVGAAGAMTVDGTASVTDISGSLSATLTSVIVAKGACWPDSGSLATSISALGESLTFDAATGTTGQASVTYQTPFGSTQPACFGLPARGACVATPCG